MEALVYGAAKDYATNCRQFHVCLNRTREVATTWSDADHQKAIEQLEREIHQVTPGKCKLFNTLFQRHEWPLLQEVETRATSPRSKFANTLATMKTGAEDEAYGAGNITAAKRLQCQIRLSNAEREAITWSLANTERVTNQLESEIYCITSNKQKWFKKQFSICLIKFESWWETIRIQALWITIEKRIIHFGYPKMHLLSNILVSIRRMSSSENITTDISELLHIANVKDAYQSSNKVNYIRQILKHNDRCSGLDSMEETLSYLALHGWYDIYSAKVFNLLSATDNRRSTHRAHLLRIQTIQDAPIIHPVSQHVYHLREKHVRGVCRSIKLTSLRDTSEDFGIPNFGQLFHEPIEEDWGHKARGLVLRYDPNLLLDSICIILPNGLWYYRQPFYNPTSVEHLGLDCKVEYTNANQGIMPEAHNIWVQNMQSEENDLDNTFQGRILSFPVLYLSWTPPNEILHIQERLPPGKALWTISTRCQTTQRWVLCPQAQQYAVVIPTKFNDLHGWADCVDGFIRVVKRMKKMRIVPIGAIVGPAHLVRENAASGGMDSVWLENNLVDLDTYWTEY